jgi:acetyl-CoA acetyltransferase
MGLCAEKTVNDFKITREQQDSFCKSSYEKAINSEKEGIFKEQIISMSVKSKGREEEIWED